MKRWIMSGALAAVVAGSGCAMNPAPYFSNPFGASGATASAQAVDQKLSLARLHERHRKVDEALTIYRQVLADDPENALANHRMGVMAAEQGDLDQAIRHFDVAQRRAGQDAEVLADLGYALYLKDDLVGAETALRKASSIAPQNDRARSNLAIVLGEQGRFDESLDQFREVVSEAEAHANVAYLQTQCGMHQEALANYHRAVELNPSLRSAGEALVQLDMRHRQAQQVAAANARTVQSATQAAAAPTAPANQMAVAGTMAIPTPPVERPLPAPVQPSTVATSVPPAPASPSTALATISAEPTPTNVGVEFEPLPSPADAMVQVAEVRPESTFEAPLPVAAPPAALPVASRPLAPAPEFEPAPEFAPAPTAISQAEPVAAPLPTDVIVTEGGPAPPQGTFVAGKGASVRLTDGGNLDHGSPASQPSRAPVENSAYVAAMPLPVQNVPLQARQPVTGRISSDTPAIASVPPQKLEAASNAGVEYIPLQPVPQSAAKPVSMRIAGGAATSKPGARTATNAEPSNIRILTHDAAPASSPTVLRLSY